MAKRSEVEIRGAKELRRTMKQAGLDLTELKAANREAASLVATAAGLMAPKSTGNLASTIKGFGTNTVGRVRVGLKRTPYAGPVHYGWPDRNIEAQPFATKAAKLTEPKWLQIYEKRIDAILDKIKGE